MCTLYTCFSAVTLHEETGKLGGRGKKRNSEKTPVSGPIYYVQSKLEPPGACRLDVHKSQAATFNHDL